MSQRRGVKRINYRDPDVNDHVAHTEHTLQDVALSILAHEKRGVPAKYAELKKDLGITNNRDWQVLCIDLGPLFKDSLGMTLINHNASILAVPKEIPQSSVAHLIEDKNGPKKAFLTTLLTIIFMEENNLPNIPMTEARLEKCLSKLGISLKTHDPVLGDVSKLVGHHGEFSKNGWISIIKTKLIGDEDHVPVYYWGPRALAGVDALKILKWHCEIDGSEPDDWERHLKKAQKLHEAMKHLQQSGR